MLKIKHLFELFHLVTSALKMVMLFWYLVRTQKKNWWYKITLEEVIYTQDNFIQSTLKDRQKLLNYKTENLYELRKFETEVFRDFDPCYRTSQLFEFDYTFFLLKWVRCVFKLQIQNTRSLDLFFILILIIFNICWALGSWKYNFRKNWSECLVCYLTYLEKTLEV